MKVVWICNFSDEKTRKHINFRSFDHRRLMNIYNYLTGKPLFKWRDYGIWISQAIEEFEKYEDITLLVILPHYGIRGMSQSFQINGVNYFCYRPEEDSVNKDYLKIDEQYLGQKYHRSRLLISQKIKEYNPDFIHLIGAENPFYSSSFLDIDSNTIPCLVTLQTLMSDKDFKKGYPISLDSYNYRTSIEQAVIKHTKFVASSFVKYKMPVERINPKVTFLHLSLASGVTIDKSLSDKEYDFVYFAGNIEKSGDYALEAFAIALRTHPDLTLNLSGSYSSSFKSYLDRRIEELGIKRNVFITGAKDTHEDVIKHIRKSRFALLPLKVDMISSTVLESMANGLPVVSTITPSTPMINSNRQSALLSANGDHKTMAANMLLLVDNPKLANEVRTNAFVTVKELFDNTILMKKWVETYNAISDYYHNGTPIPEELLK